MFISVVIGVYKVFTIAIIENVKSNKGDYTVSYS